MGDEKLLTIVISTYNRCSLLEKNLKKILGYNIHDINIIIGDNASTDGTWKMLKTIKNDQVEIVRNTHNIGMSNFQLLAYKVATSFFLYLNDRDYIEEAGLKHLVTFLKSHKGCDMIASFNYRFAKEGYRKKTNFYKFYFLADHPGLLVIRTKFYVNNIRRGVLEDIIERKDWTSLSSYVIYQLLMNVNIGFYRKENYIIQPHDRDKNVVQQRTEPFGSAYVLPNYHINLFDALAHYTYGNYAKRKVRNLLTAYFLSSLKQVELEYYYSVLSEDFKRRNHCIDCKAGDWFKNGYVYTKKILEMDKTKVYGIEFVILISFIVQSIANAIWITFFHRK